MRRKMTPRPFLLTENGLQLPRHCAQTSLKKRACPPVGASSGRQRIGLILIPVKRTPPYLYHLSPLYHHGATWVLGPRPRCWPASHQSMRQPGSQTGLPAHMCTSSRPQVELTSGDQLDKLTIVLQETLRPRPGESGVCSRSTAKKVFSSFPATQCCRLPRLFVLTTPTAKP